MREPRFAVTPIYNPIYRAIEDERIRAHAKHDPNGDSMERKDWDCFEAWLSVLMEEVGEVARVICEFRHGHITLEQSRVMLYEELTQTAAMSAAWMEATR